MFCVLRGENIKMKKIGKFICKYKTIILLISLILIVPSFINMKLTKINYNILVYLPDDIETMKGQNILADDFNMGAFSVTVLENMNAKDILKLEDKIRDNFRQAFEKSLGDEEEDPEQETEPEE